LEQHRIEFLNKRMSKAVEILERVAEHLNLDQEQRLSLTMRDFDAAPDDARKGFSARQVADAVRGSWELAKSVAFTDERMPVAAERQWERSRGLPRKRREAAFTLSGVAQWLETEPERKQRNDYDNWRETENKQRGEGQRPLMGAKSIVRFWQHPWEEVIRAVEEKRLPGEAPKQGEEIPRIASEAPQQPQAHFAPELCGQRLREAREDKGWSSNEVAVAAGLDASTVRNIERGEVRQPSFENIAKLAEIVGLQLNDFVSSD
jgi:DNA-binding XRE family transcriptional regulator